MSANPRFYEYNDKYPYDLIIKRKIEQKTITKDDGALLVRYIKDKLTKGQIAPRRAQRLATMLTQWRRFIKTPYAKMTYQDLLDGIDAERRSGEYKQTSLRGNIKAIKTFVAWMRREKLTKITADQLDEIKPPKEVFDSVKPGDLLTEEQVDKIIDACNTIRDKCIISILAETGMRPVDVGGLKWRDLNYNRDRVKLSVTTEKTETPISAYVVLRKSWLEEYRKAWNGAGTDEYVFREHDSHNQPKSEPMTYKAVDHVIKRAAKHAGVTLPKGAVAKLFRAGTITNGLRNGYSSVTVSKMAFGSPDSRMLKHYAKLVDEDQEREVLSKAGVYAEPRPEAVAPKRVPCIECGEPLTPGIKFCPHCGTYQIKGEDIGDDEMKTVISMKELDQIIKENVEAAVAMALEQYQQKMSAAQAK